jgi:acyl-CoA synthetase (AMP-forming)/AMP-acid ligase II
LPNFAYNHCARRIRQRDLEGISLVSIRAFINCSEPARHDSHQLFLERFSDLGISADKLAVSYAMAENVFAVTQTPIGQQVHIDWIDGATVSEKQRAIPTNPDDMQASATVSCGPPIPDVSVRIIDQEGQKLPDRAIGEIVIKSHCMLTEYYRRSDLHPFASDGWYRTGDMGYMADGEIYIVGRYKDMIINAGKNVYPQDIEAIINTVPGVHPGRAVVFGVPDQREGTELIAAVAEVDTEDPSERKEIERQLRQRVSQQSSVTLTYVQTVDVRWLIKTSSGKIARAANRDKWLSTR